MSLDSAPEKIDKYQVESILGRGAMGIVYKAYDKAIDRAVAIKVLHAHLLDDEMGQEFLLRFNNEVKAAAKCLHPNIVTIFDFGIHNNMPFMVMEYVQSVDLRELAKSNHVFSPEQSIAITVKILDALYEAHKHGVVHRDIKPANVLLLENGMIKVTDFGVARMDNSDLTQVGDVIGTLSYMSPEARLGRTVDHRTDLYSSGLLLYELLTGKRFSSDNTSHIKEHINLLDLTRGQKQQLTGVIENALQVDLEKRFQTAKDFSKALSHCLDKQLDYYQQSEDFAETVIQLRSQLKPASPELASDKTGTCWQNLNNEELSVIEKSLTVHLGPVAKVLLKKHAKKTESIGVLLDSLVKHLKTDKEKSEFLSEIETISQTSSSQLESNAEKKSAVILSDEQLQCVIKELTVFLGPIAKHVVKKALKNSQTIDQFYQLTAEKIPSMSEQQNFIKKMNRV